MLSSKGIIFVISKNFSGSPDCVETLQFAKQQKKKIFPLWKEKFTFDAALESLLYRTQLVDFSDASKFNENASLITAGLRKLFTVSQEGDDEMEAEDETYENFDLEESQDDELNPKKVKPIRVFISFDQSDKKIALQVQEKMKESGLICLLSKNAPLAQISQVILSSHYIIYVISKKSLESHRLRDQVALAENHNKKVLPLMSSRKVELDAAMDYTLASSPKFQFSFGESYAEDQMIYFMQTQEQVKKMVQQATKMEESYLNLKARVDKKRNEKTTQYIVNLE